MQDIFYETRNLNLNTKKRLLQIAKKSCLKWWVDELKEGDLRRTKVEMSFSEILSLCFKHSHFVVIKRFEPNGNSYGEIGFSNGFKKDERHLFLWINLSSIEFERIIFSFDLIKRNR